MKTPSVCYIVELLPFPEHPRDRKVFTVLGASCADALARFRVQYPEHAKVEVYIEPTHTVYQRARAVGEAI